MPLLTREEKLILGVDCLRSFAAELGKKPEILEMLSGGN